MTAPLPGSALADEDRARIKDVVLEVLDVEEEHLTPDASFKKDLGADSMGLVALGASLERTFDIEIEDWKVDRLDSLENVFAVVDEALAAHR
ncbi:acyl carrier protein [Streptomyces sp. NPDC059063]|uniref:acyl carrier protein n=1 Tax=unclassified Streptomyces TaxID=2593676 RepID=UPI00369F1989